MKYTYLEPNSKLSKEWAEYSKSWQLNKRKESKKKRRQNRKRPSPTQPSSQSSENFFSIQEIKKAAASYSLSVKCVE
jgi:hypothetical protein